jgi:hypothetical protein
MEGTYERFFFSLNSQRNKSVFIKLLRCVSRLRETSSDVSAIKLMPIEY